jgi:hypothetical protein
MQDADLPAAAPADISKPNFDLANYIADFIAKLVFSVPKPVAQRVLNIGKTRLHDLLGEGKLDAVKNGQRTEITVESIQKYQRSLPPATFKPPPPPRMENLSKLHAKQRQCAAQRRAKRAEHRRSKARGE